MQQIYDIFHDWGFPQGTGLSVLLVVLVFAAFLARFIRSVPVRVAAAVMIMVAAALPVVVGASVLIIGFGQPGPRSIRMWVGAVVWGGGVVILACRAIGGSTRGPGQDVHGSG